MSLIAVVTVVVLSASFSQFASAVANRQAQAVNRKRAFYMAEAGLAEGFAALTCGKSGNVGTLEAPALLGEGVFWVEASELEPGYVRLEATGMVASGRAELALVARRGTEDVAALGVFSGGAVTLGAGSLVDAYDSSLGTYATQSDKSGASLGSNGNISVSGSALKPTTIKGDVTPGPDGHLTQLGNVTISGSTSVALEATEFPAIDVPAIALGAAQVHSSPYPLVIPPGSVGYTSLTVQSGAQVLIQGPAQVLLGSLTLNASAQLSFDTSGGPIDLFVTDAADLAATSLLSTTGTNPEDVRILVPGQTAQSLKLRSSGPFHGVIYAPEAALVLGNTFELFGAVVSKGLVLEGAAKLHFDKHLAEVAAEELLPLILSWRLVELANLTGDLATDPFTLLGLDKNVLPAPSGAHMDQTLVIDYFDASSVYHRYSGPESKFDWNVVQSVISATRDGVQVVFPISTSTKSGVRKSPGVLPVIDGPMI
ncbi:MAG: hypothetical protein EXS08_10230 [Planctomycetes bacterium]|nr:hypothetical protein [Planctomycetota bacterium]